MKRIYKNLFRNPLSQKTLGFLLFLYLNFVYLSSRKQYIYPKNFKKHLNSKSSLMVFWHNRTTLIPFLTTKEKINNGLISSHPDGRFLSNIFTLFGVQVIFGSTNRNATTALREILRAIQREENICVALDGPRGPKYNVNSNLMVVAQKNNVPVVPISYNCKRKITLSSWDNMIIPLPFNNIIFRYGSVIEFSSNDVKTPQEINTVVKKAIDSISDNIKDFE